MAFRGEVHDASIRSSAKQRGNRCLIADIGLDEPVVDWLATSRRLSRLPE